MSKRSGPTCEGTERFSWGVFSCREYRSAIRHSFRKDMNRSFRCNRSLWSFDSRLRLFEYILSLVSDWTDSTHRVSIVCGTLIWIGLNWSPLPLINLVGILLLRIGLSRVCGGEIALCLWILHRWLIAGMQIAFQITCAIAIPELL
jgi:hypothetical protein